LAFHRIFRFLDFGDRLPWRVLLHGGLGQQSYVSGPRFRADESLRACAAVVLPYELPWAASALRVLDLRSIARLGVDAGAGYF
jgi:hypothetical protein